VLGAALAPTDATAVGVLTRMLPRRNVTVLRAESLVNDGTALVVYSIAVAVTVGTQRLTLGGVSGMLLLSYAGGIAAGAVAAWVGMLILRRVDAVVLENLVTSLVPFTAFLAAEAIGASGVLAVVVAGLIVSQLGPKYDRAETRQQVRSFWSFATFVLNGSLFVLVGIEATAAARNLAGSQLVRGVVIVLLVSVLLVAIRFVFLWSVAGGVWAITRATGGSLREGHRDRLISGFSGFRGAVSLAAAVAVPRTIESGAAFPDRNLIVFVAGGVVIVTIVGQALLLPGIVRRAALPEDDAVLDELRLAEDTSIEEALDALPRLAEEAGADDRTVTRVRRDLERQREVVRAQAEEDEDHPVLVRRNAAVDLRLALVRHRVETLLRLRDDGDIDDMVLRQVQSRLDAEETRLLGPDHPAGD
jgi:CPA1 family monovalent cation:H+ antiporter